MSKPSKFFGKCKTCYGKGEVPWSSPEGIAVEGHSTGYDFPERQGGMSGEIEADNRVSLCRRCRGTGIMVK